MRNSTVMKQQLDVIKTSSFHDRLSWGIWINANSVIFIFQWFGSLISSHYADFFHGNEKKMRDGSSSFLLMWWLPSVRVIRKSAPLNFENWLEFMIIRVWGPHSLRTCECPWLSLHHLDSLCFFPSVSKHAQLRELVDCPGCWGWFLEYSDHVKGVEPSQCEVLGGEAFER